MQEIRCIKCNKKLAEANFNQLAIKCPRCKFFNNLSAKSTATTEVANGKTDKQNKIALTSSRVAGR